MTDDPRIDPADLRNVRFPGSSRRYDARSVDQFLETVAVRITATNALVDELRAQLASPQPDPAAPLAAAVGDLSGLDDDALLRLVGEETASVLATARRAADEIRSKAEEAAARMIREATAEADQLTAEARERAAALTAEATDVHEHATAAAEEAAARIREEAEAAAEALREAARDEGRSMVAEAREVRSRILDDLQRRRDVARAHVERLLEARERLLGAYELVRENLDGVTGELAEVGPVPSEPELPDGFHGAVGTAGDDAADEDRGDEAQDDEDHLAEDTASEGASPGDAAGQDGLGYEDVAAGGEPDAADAVDDGSDEHGADAPADDAGPAPDDTRAPVGAATPPPEAVADEPVEVTADDAALPPVDPDEPVEDDLPGGDVDALFARLRAERERSVARAQEVLGADDAPAPAASAPDEVPAGEVTAVEHADGGGAPAGDVDRVPGEFLAGADALARRAEALAPLGEALNRALKRRLADEQNELLDLLRRTASTDPADLLPAGDEQVRAYARIAQQHLVSAAIAGAGDGAAEVDVAELADALGRTLVEPFRRRVERAAGDVDDADELDERLRALYREWKVQHVGPAVEDTLLTAFATGTRHAAGAGTSLRWLIDPTQGPCPDAQDNALAGPVPTGEAFPTGDTCPQAHPGCRCMLVADAAE